VEKPRRKRRHRLRNTLLVLLVIVLGLGALTWFWIDSNLTRVEALSGAPNTPGRTYLIVGSDARKSDPDNARTDTIMLLHQPTSGPTALISIPRDSYVEIPGHNPNKINAAYAFGGAPLLVETVEELSGLTIDGYFEVGFQGVASVVDAVGGVELCYDRDVTDKRSKLEWESGCHVVDGKTALAFSRMRYSDPLGDIGRTQRQQQVVSKVTKEAFKPGVVFNPFRLHAVGNAGMDAVKVSEGTSPLGVAQAALAFRSARGDDAVTGTPPIKDMGHRVKGVGSTVLLDPEKIDRFWEKIANGEYEPGTVVGGFG